jgi:energy-coupling factor transport system permease protein
MLRDITIGQYYPVNSTIHRLDPRVKLLAVFLYLISLFVFSSFAGYIVVTVFLMAVIALSKVPLTYIVKGLKPILFLLLFTAVFHIFGTKGDALLEWKFISITWQGLRKGLFMSMRLIYLILGSSLLTYTTTPTKLTDGLELLLKPLEKLHVPVHDFAMIMSLALRFIPILLEEANRIMNAQSARGADFEEGSLWQRMRSMTAILIPLFVSSIRRAYDLAMAMEARCYRGGEGRTRLKPLQLTRDDWMAGGIVVVYFIAVIVVSHVILF